MELFGKWLEMLACSESLKALDQPGVFVSTKALDPLMVSVLFTLGKTFWFKGRIFKSWIGEVYKILTHL